MFLEQGDNLNSFEDSYGYHYQARVYPSNPPFGQWVYVDIDLSYHINQALQYFGISYAADTLKLAQFEFLAELKNAQISFAIDNLYLKYSTPPPPPPPPPGGGSEGSGSGGRSGCSIT